MRKLWLRPGPAIRKSLPLTKPQFPHLEDQGSNTLLPIDDSGMDYYQSCGMKNSNFYSKSKGGKFSAGTMQCFNQGCVLL